MSEERFIFPSSLLKTEEVTISSFLEAVIPCDGRRLLLFQNVRTEGRLPGHTGEEYPFWTLARQRCRSISNRLLIERVLEGERTYAEYLRVLQSAGDMQYSS
jgi:hypothetical protein